ncbi:uncharacterized protein LOC62_03G004384 [Vanrija pseudolonga]|uniref:Uncharacterized protein n=1 Tax=Vanrija pseudolonga TaxID=143232 RepID=A0AAF0Y6I0_9TREE|nr:hypothetical protein LOC62_03G004384 [Vanrija pseudolonga]
MAATTAYAAYVKPLGAYYAYVPTLLSPVHPSYLPIGPLDVVGLMRLSSVVNWVASDTKGKPRASALQEVFGIWVVMCGAETFLALATGVTPPWLLNPTFPIVAAVMHLVNTRTPLIKLLPEKPTLALELIAAVPDAIGRVLLCTRFTTLPILYPGSSWLNLPATPSTLLLVPFIFAVPFAAFAFTGGNLFAPEVKLTTPAELRPWGWTAVDAWIPLFITTLFLMLIGPKKGWRYGFGTYLEEDAAIVVCAIVTIVIFEARAIWNFAPRPKKSGKKSKKSKKVEKEKAKAE